MSDVGVVLSAQYLFSSAESSLVEFTNRNLGSSPDAAFATLDLTPGVQGASRDELIESAEYFHVDRIAAEKRYTELLSAISGWQALAQKLNIRRNEFDRMLACFCKAEFVR